MVPELAYSVMGGLDPPTHLARVRARMTTFSSADADVMDGRVKPAHDGL